MTAVPTGGRARSVPQRRVSARPRRLRRRRQAVPEHGVASTHFRGGDAGSATVELVVAAPLLALLLMLVVQFGVWAHAQHIAQAAANQALQTARAYHSSAAAGDEQARELLDQTGGSILTDRTVSVTRTATTVTVTITGRAASVVPGLRAPVAVSVTGPVERVSSVMSTVDGGG